MKRDGVIQTKDHGKSGIKQHLAWSLGLQPHQNSCGDPRWGWGEVAFKKKRNWLLKLSEELSSGDFSLSLYHIL